MKNGNVTCQDISGAPGEFLIELNEEKQMVSLKSRRDAHGMNWAKGEKLWGTLEGGAGLSVTVKREFTGQGTLLETYLFENKTGFDIYTTGTELGIYTPFPDYYTDAETCMTQCCNTHIWCGGSSSYVMALRMGGEEPHLGLVLRRGGLKGYSVKRLASTNGREEELSNHRGDFILHPEDVCLKPGEQYVLAWELFWFRNQAAFEKKLLETPGFLLAEAERFVVLGEEKIRFWVRIGEEAKEPDREQKPCEEAAVSVVTADGKAVPYSWDNGRILVEEKPGRWGEHAYEIRQKERHTRVSFYASPDVWELAGKRCRFIAENQQCQDKDSHLYGAYLVYDNETGRLYYSHKNDQNGGRERVGMGVLMALYLQKQEDTVCQRSLNQYVEYILRELYDEATGEVFNDAPRCRDYIRLYNYPWMCRFFLELYRLKGEEIYLDRYFKCARFFYQAGGTHFYAIGMPMYESVGIFRQAGRKEQAEELLKLYRAQGDFMVACGRHYPAHEVDYEQSIVAPAAVYMGELYRLTGEETYQRAYEEQLSVLRLFQGNQPDYHLNQVAIRHWDGYWFGKRRCLGDTFPHYWSALSGYAYCYAKGLAGLSGYGEQAERTLRGVLSLFEPDGRASCAMVYPMSVNKREAHFYDPWANDQDWGLYFNLKYGGKTEQGT